MIKMICWLLPNVHSRKMIGRQPVLQETWWPQLLKMPKKTILLMKSKITMTQPVLEETSSDVP